MQLVPPNHPALRAVALPVSAPAHYARVIRQMKTMLDGVGGACLAAPQVGVELCIVVSNNAKFPVAINPTWEPHGNARTSRPEMSLNKMGASAYRPRYDYIVARFFDESGVAQVIPLESNDARVFQHACDYLTGKPPIP